ncbi:MAG: hypothetical protein F4X64_02400, partial [Chloroflexi bacterium]|nr:hypothetical protein [Chloroflexota bacterium]
RPPRPPGRPPRPPGGPPGRLPKPPPPSGRGDDASAGAGRGASDGGGEDGAGVVMWGIPPKYCNTCAAVQKGRSSTSEFSPGPPDA